MHTAGTRYAQLRAAPLAPAHWAALARIYADAGLPWQRGYAFQQLSRLDAASAWTLSGALAADPRREGGRVLAGAAADGQAHHWRVRFERALAADPRDWLTALYHQRLRELCEPALLAETVDASGAAAARWAPLLALEPLPGETWHWLGLWRLRAGQDRAALAALAPLVPLVPIRHGSMLFLGEALARTGQAAAAELAFARAARSPCPELLGLLARTLSALKAWDQALAVRRRLVALRPRQAEDWMELGALHAKVWRIDEARQCYLAALEIQPGHPAARHALVALMARVGDAAGNFDAAEAMYNNSDPLGRSGSTLAMASLYNDALDANQVAAIHRRVCAPVERALAPVAAAARARLDARLDARLRGEAGAAPLRARRLRIGYVTGDLGGLHPVRELVLPVLQGHDRRQVDVLLYHGGAALDARARQAADVCRETAAWGDKELQQRILADRVDVLVDLDGHTHSHRLGAFAMRAAPVQATFQGYPGTTGLREMDWIIGDPVVTPLAHAALYSEAIAHMPGSVFCWTPTERHALPPPRGGQAALVLGSFNNALKLSASTLALWARILHALPQAQLLIKAPSLDSQRQRRQLTAHFHALGVAPGRLLLRGPSPLDEMMREYGDVDIALDTFPYNGGATTLQALWMGVPVVTLCGAQFAGRMGASLLRALGRGEWVARDGDAYLAAVVALAARLEAVRGGRGALRQRMRTSALCATAPYTRALEALYRKMWSARASRLSAPRLRADTGR